MENSEVPKKRAKLKRNLPKRRVGRPTNEEATSRRRRENAGRPTVMTPETLEKLDQAFLLGATDEEACLYAGINPATYYNYVKRNPKYIDKVRELRQRQRFKARAHIAKRINDGDDVNLLKWFLERRDQAFSPKMQVSFKELMKQIDLLDDANLDRVAQGDFTPLLEKLQL